ncbi:MAG: ribosome assembly cofactor RimP [Bacteroidales bacterium]|nr:ribosome assembly cofactor RimP [Bacteroidales bacterium]
MIGKENILKIVREYPGGEDFFVVDIRISPSNRVSVFVDRMGGVSIDECAKVSRFIENHLDREKEDFELIVSSPGLDAPFTVYEQYLKNIGKKIKIQLKNGETHLGKLTAMENDAITLEEQVKKREKQGQAKKNKNKEINIKTAVYPLTEIKTAKPDIEIK